jgi:hypothetical protein
MYNLQEMQNGNNTKSIMWLAAEVESSMSHLKKGIQEEKHKRIAEAKVNEIECRLADIKRSLGGTKCLEG